jgi:D-3-phosphoglycerate dehydrogenase
MRCVITQPIDSSGCDLLRAAGIEPVAAPSTDLPDLAPLLADTDAVITRNWGFPLAAMALAPRLRVISVHGTGMDRIAMDEAARRGIPVVACPGANAQSAAEHALALMLAVARSLPLADTAMRNGDFGWRDRIEGVELSGRCLGLWGWGEVARRLAPMAQAMGMELLVLTSRADPQELEAAGCARASDENALLSRADVLSLHLRAGATPALGAAQFMAMRAGAILINTARGALVEEAALVAALRQGHLRGAGLDVFTAEPPTDRVLIDCPGLVLSPHIGGSTADARRRMARASAKAVVLALTGPQP